MAGTGVEGGWERAGATQEVLGEAEPAEGDRGVQLFPLRSRLSVGSGLLMSPGKLFCQLSLLFAPRQYPGSPDPSPGAEKCNLRLAPEGLLDGAGSTIVIGCHGRLRGFLNFFQASPTNNLVTSSRCIACSSLHQPSCFFGHYVKKTTRARDECWVDAALASHLHGFKGALLAPESFLEIGTAAVWRGTGDKSEPQHFRHGSFFNTTP